MKTCLVHERAFVRMQSRLRDFERQLNVLTMTDEGQFYVAGSSLVPDEVEPDIVFGSMEAFFSPAARDFMLAALNSRRLDWFQSAAAGVDDDALKAVGRRAKLYTANHRQAEAMSEWVLWLALDFLRGGPAHRAQQAAREWKRINAREIAGSRWLIVGFGSVGEAVGKRISALGGHVTGLRRSSGESPGAHEILPSRALLDELPKADVVLLSLPYTPENDGVAGTDFFSRMRPDSLFINIGRGALVDEDALIVALDMGRPAHAALDVTRVEPLPWESPLWNHPRITITPHDSPSTLGTTLRADETFLANLGRYLAGAPLLHLIDPQVFAA